MRKRSRSGAHSESSFGKSKSRKTHGTLGRAQKQDRIFTKKQNEYALNPDTELSHEDLYELSKSHLEGFRNDGEVEDIVKAIEYGNRALNRTPDGHPDLSSRHAGLGVSYTDRFRRLGDLDDLKKAVEHDYLALKLTPEAHPEQSERHASLGVSYTDRFRRLGNLGDLEKAIEHLTRALEMTPNEHSDKSERHASLGVSYTDRFRRLGNLNDLEKAIENDCLALELVPNNHPDKAKRHASLGVSYTDRFQRLGDLDALEKAIEHLTRALELTPDGHRDKSSRHASLGVSYTDRFRRLGNPNDLKKAIENDCLALELVPNNHPDKAKRHASLGVSYTDRFQHLGDLDALEKSIEHLSRAIELTPDGHPEKSERHASLGVSYNDRFRRLGVLDDIKKAIEHSSRALKLTPNGHPEMSNYNFHQAETLLSQYQHTRKFSHFDKSMDSFRKACQLLTGAPRSNFQHALRWASVASAHSSKSPVCIEAYQTAISLLPQFIWLGATASQQYHDLSTAKNLAVNAAHVAILHSDLKLTLEWLEHARCVVWNQTIMLRSPVYELQSSYRDLADRLQIVSRHLHSGSSGPSNDQSTSSSAGPDSVSQHRYRLAREYDSLIARIRSLPGYEDFLLPMKADRLVFAARTGPIAVINCHIDQCDALIILPGQGDVMHVPLPSFTEEKARGARSELYSVLRTKGLRERGVKLKEGPGGRQDIGRVLASLWYHIVKPVLDFLGYTTSVSRSQSSLPHITWCPTGALSFLPLHAAGDYNQPGGRVFEYAISSYTPTLTALLATSPTSLDSTSRALLVGQAHTPGRSPLPGTTEELELVKAQVQTQAQYSQLTL